MASDYSLVANMGLKTTLISVLPKAGCAREETAESGNGHWEMSRKIGSDYDGSYASTESLIICQNTQVKLCMGHVGGSLAAHKFNILYS